MERSVLSLEATHCVSTWVALRRVSPERTVGVDKSEVQASCTLRWFEKQKVNIRQRAITITRSSVATIRASAEFHFGLQISELV
eukprot:287032-Amphidinium_carterae.2